MNIVKATRKLATREEAHRAIFCGLSCDLLTSSRWSDFTAVPTLGSDHKIPVSDG